MCGRAHVTVHVEAGGELVGVSVPLLLWVLGSNSASQAWQ